MIELVLQSVGLHLRLFQKAGVGFYRMHCPACLLLLGAARIFPAFEPCSFDLPRVLLLALKGLTGACTLNPQRSTSSCACFRGF